MGRCNPKRTAGSERVSKVAACCSFWGVHAFRLVLLYAAILISNNPTYINHRLVHLDGRQDRKSNRPPTNLIHGPPPPPPFHPLAHMNLCTDACPVTQQKPFVSCIDTHVLVGRRRRRRPPQLGVGVRSWWRWQSRTRARCYRRRRRRSSGLGRGSRGGRARADIGRRKV